MRVERLSAVAEFVRLFGASGLYKSLIEVTQGMASPHFAFYIVNKGIFSRVEGNKGEMRALLPFECVCLLIAQHLSQLLCFHKSNGLKSSLN